MPIRIVIRNNLSCPVVFCDHCQQEIQTAKDGNYEWAFDENVATDIFFVHKACSDGFREAHPEITSSAELTVLQPYYVRDVVG